MTDAEALLEAKTLFTKHIEFVEKLKSKSDTDLRWAPDADSWSSFQILDHLEISGDLYLDRMQEALDNAPASGHGREYLPTWLGRTLRKLSGPDSNAKPPKMFLPRPNPSRDVMDKLVNQWGRFNDMIERSVSRDVTQATIKSPALPFPKMSLLDALLIHADHGVRHLGQIEDRMRIIESRS